jgi:hypothetical protein
MRHLTNQVLTRIINYRKYPIRTDVVLLNQISFKLITLNHSVNSLLNQVDLFNNKAHIRIELIKILSKSIVLPLN